MIKQKEIKKQILYWTIFIVIVLILFCTITSLQYTNYKRIINKTISGIVDNMLEKYPNTSEEEIILILQNKKQVEESVLDKYGYAKDFLYINELEENMNKNLILNSVMIIFFSILGSILVFFYNRIQDKKIKEIYKYLSKVNNGNYELNIEDNGEDELSKLRNELYKTTILLKESAENSEKEKKDLSNSLADISHQLKTPITSIRIMLDNIHENPEMDENIKKEFIDEISKQIDWISSLVISLLKLAKFDAGSIVMNDKEINLNTLINEVISNLEIMLELKNIEIEKNIDKNIMFIADYKWQLEALTNIIKNAIEHSKENSKIYVRAEDTSVFLKITIKDTGDGIDKEDLKNIFKRFYKSKNSDENSIGIGLSLAKIIIEKEDGYIKVDSNKGEGTTFEIKYLK